jgi:hypothetical protein
MSVSALSAFVLPAAALVLLLARSARDRRAWAWCVVVGAGLGVGLSTLVWVLLLLTFASALPVESLVVVDAIVWTVAAGAAAFVFWRRGAPARGHAPTASSRAALWATALAVLALAAAGGAAFVARTIVWPHGGWDAWAIWNARARFLFRTYPTAWIDLYPTVPDWSHAGYPLLVPLAVARGWSYAGGEETMIPASLAGLFWLATTAAVAGSVGRASGAVRGLLSAAVLLASPALLIYGTCQCADVPLAFFIVSAFVLMAAAFDADALPLWGLSGLSAGLAAWTKNEGIAFFLLFFGVSAWQVFRREGRDGWKRLAALLAGAAAPLAAVVAFKLSLAPTNYLAAGQSLAAVATRLTDLNRYATVAIALARDLWLGGASWVGVLPITALFLVVSGIRRGGNPVPALASCVGVGLVLVYAVVYLLTPLDLAKHLESSSDRLILHVTPLFVWAAMMQAKS